MAALILLVSGVAGAVPPVAGISGCDAVPWRVQPMVGTPDDTQAVVNAVPNAAVTVRLWNPAAADWADTRKMEGAEATIGAVGAFTQRTGTWASMVDAWDTSAASTGVALLANQGIEFRLTGLTANTRYTVQMECLEGNRWGPIRRFGRLSFLTLPAADAAAAVRFLYTSDTHVTQGYGTWVGEDISLAATDDDSDGVVDAQENYERALRTLSEAAEWASSAHALIDLGDTGYMHNVADSGCDATPIGPCNSTSIIDSHNPATGTTQLARQGDSMSSGPLGGAGDVVGWYDDTVDIAEARLGFALNRFWPITRNTASLFLWGNHEAGNRFVEEDCSGLTVNQILNGSGHINCTNAAHASANQMQASRQATRNYVNNPNDFHPNGETGEDNDLEEQGFYFKIETGKVVNLFLNEYIHTNGKEGGTDASSGYLFAAGTTYAGGCFGTGDPTRPCFSAANGGDMNAYLPSTPWEWTLGDVQKAWALAEIAAASAGEVVVLYFHHAPGGVGLASQYSYGRLPIGSGARYCQDAEGGSDIVVNASIKTRLTGSIVEDVDKVPCWDGTVGVDDQSDPDERWCDWVVDGSNDGDGHCGPIVDENLLWGEAGELQAALEDHCESGGTSIVVFGHDHVMSERTRNCVHWWNIGQSGGQITAAWAYGTGVVTDNGTQFSSYSDSDEDGIPDYAQSQYVKDSDTDEPDHDYTLEVPPPFAWDGKGFGVLDVSGTGVARLRYVSTPGHEATTVNPDGAVVMDRTITP